jgi:hypothetical protein
MSQLEAKNLPEHTKKEACKESVTMTGLVPRRKCTRFYATAALKTHPLAFALSVAFPKTTCIL